MQFNPTNKLKIKNIRSFQSMKEKRPDKIQHPFTI